MNTSIFYFFYNLSHQSAAFDKFIIFWADTSAIPVFLLAGLYFAYLFIFHRDWKDKKWITWFWECFTIGASIFSAWLMSFIIKIIVHAPRPYVKLHDLTPLIVHGGYDSFPSGHATVFFGLATAIYLYNKKAGILFYLFAILIALARVITGVHFPLDIFVGALLGIFIAAKVHFILSSLLGLRKQKTLVEIK